MLASFLNSSSTSQVLFWPLHLVSALWTGLSSEGFPWLAPVPPVPTLTAGSGSEGRLCSPLAPRLPGTVTTMQITAPLLKCKQKRISLTWFLLTAVSFSLFFFGMRFLLAVWGVGWGVHFQSPPRTLSKTLCCVAKRVSACHQISVYSTFHSRAHLGIQETEMALTYRVDHKLLAN